MKRTIALLLLAALLAGYHAPVHAQAPQYVYCVSATSTQCNTSGNPGNGTQGDDAWLAFGKLNLDIAALQPPSPMYSLVYADGSSFGGLLPVSGGTWCLNWSSLSAPPTLTTCPGGGSSFSSITAGTNPNALVVSGTLTTSGGGTISATTAGSLLNTPAQCSGGQFATGVAANGAANCSTPAGSGNVSNEGSPTQYQTAVFFGPTNILGISTGTAGMALVSGGASAYPAYSASLSGVTSVNGTSIPASVTLTKTIVPDSTVALGTGSIASGACASAVTVSASAIATTDIIGWSFNSDPTSIVGYEPSTNGMLTIIVYPTAGNANFKVCNNTAGAVTPGAITLNWRVTR